MPRCKDCAFCDQGDLGGDNGFCRRHAPNGFSPGHVFPVIAMSTDWCGEFEDKPTKIGGFDLPEFQAWLRMQDSQGVADFQRDEDGVISGVLHVGIDGLQRLVFIKEMLLSQGVDLNNISINRNT